MRFLIVSFFFFSLLALPIAAQLSPTSSLPPQAQEPFEKGLVAAQMQDFAVAIRNFTEVQKEAPFYPPVLFNLGLAHGKAGHELPAVAWLHAYLAASPQSGNAEEVRKEIARLEAAAEIKRDKIFQTAVRAARAIPSESERLNDLGTIALLQSSCDIEGALKTAEEGKDSNASKYWLDYADTLSRFVGDDEGARNALAKVSPSKENYYELSRIHSNLRDFEEADHFAQKIPDPGLRGGAVLYIKDQQDLWLSSEVRELLDAKRLTQARQRASTFRFSWYKSRVLGEIALAEMRAGHRSTAQAIAQELLQLGHPGAPDRMQLSGIIDFESAAVAKAILGEYGSARSLAGQDFLKGRDAFSRVAYVQALVGELKGANETAGVSADLNTGTDRATAYNYALAEIARAQIHVRDMQGANQTIGKMTTSEESSWLKVTALLSLAEAYAQGGQFALTKRIVENTTAIRLPMQARIELLERIAQLQTKFRALSGLDVAGLRRPPSDELKSWVLQAAVTSNWDPLVNIETRLRNAAASNDITGLAVVGSSLGDALLQVSFMEKKFSRRASQ